MLRKLIPAALVIILAAIGVYVILIVSDEEEKVTSTNEIESNDLPAMRFATRDGVLLSGKDLPGNSILIFFQPDCDHCQREALEISENAQAFKDYTLYFITPDSFESMQQFAATYKLENLDRTVFLQTSVNEILNHLGRISAPSLYIYSKDKKLVKHLDGEKPVKEIIEHL